MINSAELGQREIAGIIIEWEWKMGLNGFELLSLQ